MRLADCRARQPSVAGSQACAAGGLRQIDHYVAEAVEHRLGIHGNDAGGIVFLDNAGSLPSGYEVCARQHRHLDPTSLGAEISPTTGRMLCGVRFDPNGIGHTRPVWNTPTDHLKTDDLDRLVRAGAVAIGDLVFSTERLFERADGVLRTGPSGTGIVNSNDWPL